MRKASVTMFGDLNGRMLCSGRNKFQVLKFKRLGWSGT